MSQLEEEFLAQIELLELPEPIREYRFHETRRWRLDFAWPFGKADSWLSCRPPLGVEIQGGIYVRGRHSRGAALEREYEKLNTLSQLGWVVLKFGPQAVANGTAAETVARELLGDAEFERRTNSISRS